MGTQINSQEISLVVCGRYEQVDDEKITPDEETGEIISNLVDTLQRKELHPYVDVNFCNCGNAYENGPSIAVLPEQVRYLDIDDATINKVIDRHVRSVVRSGEGR